MRPSEVLRHASDYLERHGIDSPRETAEVLMMAVLGTDRAGLYTRTDRLGASEERMFGRALRQRGAGTPLQHLTGEQAFRRITLEVRPGVFIPRPETETLVSAALRELGDTDAPVVVDVGTGTGAIALSIKDERPDANVFATDISPEAVDLARANAAHLGLDVAVFEGDMFDPLPPDLRGWVDLVVSDPPYVTPQEYEDLPVEVRADPELALVGGIDVIERLADRALRWLRDGGVLAVEIGASQGKDVVKGLGRSFADVRLEFDLAGRDRVVVGHRP
jgi:release factor glutamine methyltransferase